ncbi:MAG: hypothetical protein AAF629_37330 [Chloroflexota bacterium]
MYNLYEMEQLGQVRRQELREKAKRYHQRQHLQVSRISLLASVTVTCGDLLISLGHKLKYWYAAESTLISRYQLDVRDVG